MWSGSQKVELLSLCIKLASLSTLFPHLPSARLNSTISYFVIRWSLHKTNAVRFSAIKGKEIGSYSHLFLNWQARRYHFRNCVRAITFVAWINCNCNGIIDKFSHLRLVFQTTQLSTNQFIHKYPFPFPFPGIRAPHKYPFPFPFSRVKRAPWICVSLPA